MGTIGGRFCLRILLAVSMAAGFAHPATANLPSPADVDANIPALPPVTPSTTVVATIDGDDEIRQDDLDLEVRNKHHLQGEDPTLLARRSLQDIIDRRLLIRVFGDKSMRVTPSASAEARRAQQAGFYQACVVRFMTAFKPTDAEVAAYLQTHPHNHIIYRVDQLRVQVTQADLPKLEILLPDHSLDAVIAHLNGLGLAFERSEGRLDTTQILPMLAEGIAKLPPGEPFLVGLNGSVMVYVIRGREVVQETPQQARRIVVYQMMRENNFKVFAAGLKAERARAKITYRSGYEPRSPTPQG